MKKQRNITMIYIVILMMSALGLISCGKKADIVMATKNFTENIILAEMMSVMIQSKTDLSVEIKYNMGSTFVVYQAMESNSIDIFPDYTGTLYQAKLKKKERVNAEESYKIVKQELYDTLGWVIFDTFGFNNTYAIGLPKAKAQELEIYKISDLQNYPYLIAGFDSEFIGRLDGATAMFDFYNIQPNKIVSFEIGLRYQAINEGNADYTNVYSTDSKLKRFDMMILEDDKFFFPPYYAVPVVRKEIIEKYPELIAVLSLLSNILDENEMIDLNYKVEEEKLDINNVVTNFLKEKNVL